METKSASNKQQQQRGETAAAALNRNVLFQHYLSKQQISISHHSNVQQRGETAAAAWNENNRIQTCCNISQAAAAASILPEAISSSSSSNIVVKQDQSRPQTDSVQYKRRQMSQLNISRSF